MTEAEVKAYQIIIDLIQKENDKRIKKEEKAKEKHLDYVTYKGEKYFSYDDIQEAYECDLFDSTVCDKLMSKLDDKHYADKFDSENQKIINELSMFVNQLRYQLRENDILQENQKQKEMRIRGLVDHGYSLREAETIVLNDDLTNQIDM